MGKNAQMESNDIFVNVRMPRTLVEKLDKFEEKENLTRSKKVIRAVEFLSESRVCPRCHTINAKNSVICSVCKSDFAVFDIVKAIEAVKLYIEDYKLERPLLDESRKYDYSFKLRPLRFFIVEKRKIDLSNKDDYEFSQEFADWIDEDGYVEEGTANVPMEIMNQYLCKVTDDQIINSLDLSYISYELKADDAKRNKRSE